MTADRREVLPESLPAHMSLMLSMPVVHLHQDSLHGNSDDSACCLIRWRDIGAPRQSCRCFATWMASLTRQMCRAMSVRMLTKQSQRSLSVRSFMILVRDFTEVLSGIIVNAFGKVWQAGFSLRTYTFVSGQTLSELGRLSQATL